MHNLRDTLEQRWSYKQATDFASVFDSVDRESLRRIMAVDGMPPPLTLGADQDVLRVNQGEGYGMWE